MTDVDDPQPEVKIDIEPIKTEEKPQAVLTNAIRSLSTPSVIQMSNINTVTNHNIPKTTTGYYIRFQRSDNSFSHKKMSLASARNLSIMNRTNRFSGSPHAYDVTRFIQQEKDLQVQAESLEAKIKSMKMARAMTDYQSEMAICDKAENSIIEEVQSIQDSISKLLEERTALQAQHKSWLNDRKKKILQLRKETHSLINPNCTYPNPLLKLRVID